MTSVYSAESTLTAMAIIALKHHCSVVEGNDNLLLIERRLKTECWNTTAWPCAMYDFGVACAGHQWHFCISIFDGKSP